MKPDTRRAIRTVMQAIVTLAILAFVWLWTPSLAAHDLIKVVLSCLVIIGIQTLGNQMENGLRAFKLKAGRNGVGVEAEATGESAEQVLEKAE